MSWLPMQPDTATQWFADRGYSLRFWQKDSAVWADLVLVKTGAVISPRFGKAASAAAAPQSAIERYKLEQEEG